MALAIRPRARIQRRLQLRLDSSLVQRIEACADRSGVSVAALLQLVLEDALVDDAMTLAQVLNRKGGEANLPALAALWAAEETRRALIDAMPYAKRTSPKNRADALLDAEERLEELRRHMDEIA